MLKGFSPKLKPVTCSCTRTPQFQSTASSPAVDKNGAVKQELLKNDSKEEVETEKWMEQKLDIRKLPVYYMRLSKIRLTGSVPSQF